MIAVDRIITIGSVTLKDGYRRVSYRDANGDSAEAELGEAELEHFLRSPVHIAPALPGTFIVDWYGGEDESSDHGFTPVIAWAATMAGDVLPVTVSGVNDGVSEPGPVLTPDGQVNRSEIRVWENLEDYLIDQRVKKRTGELLAGTTAASRDPA